MNIGILTMALQAYRREGLSYLICAAVKSTYENVKNYICLCYYKIFRSGERFEFQGKSFRYLFHPYSASWKNERTVVLPIVWDTVKRYQEQNKNILEVGNVLSHVFKVTHDILDKYEIMTDVINEDVVSFNPSKKYDLIVSIVTLQYVGLSESERNPNKFFHAIDNLKRLLVSGGQLIIIHPLGENFEMDKSLIDGTLAFDKKFYLRKIGGFRWNEVELEDVRDLKYDSTTPSANGIIIAIFKKD
jgi:hypothetical protein